MAFVVIMKLTIPPVNTSAFQLSHIKSVLVNIVLLVPCSQLWTPSGNAKNGKNRHSLGSIVVCELPFFRSGGNENSTCMKQTNE